MSNKNVEAVLQYINKNFVTVADGDIKDSNCLLSKVLDEITTSIRSVSVLFHHLFEKYTYGGSFYDGLKVSKPDEFDIDLKLKLPAILDIQLEPADRDGFVYIKLKDWNRLVSDDHLFPIYSDLEKLKDGDNYLSQEKVKQWMQGIVQEAINRIKENGTMDIELKPSMSGPAVTLNVTYKHVNMDIDLVAVFRIPEEKWPEAPVRQNTNRIWKDFLVVPKAPKDVVLNSECYWRLSFPDQEREMIKRLNHCKPAIRLIEKLRDTRNPSIPSYFIKTIFLWEIERRENNGEVNFWNSSLTEVFLHMLETYKTCLENKKIAYFWSANNNFLEPISELTIKNIKNYLNGMLKEINRNSDPYAIAEYLLPRSEFLQMQEHFQSNNNWSSSSERESCAPSTWSSETYEPVDVRVSPSGTTQKQKTGLSTEAKVAITGAVVVGVGAIIGGLIALAKPRNRND